MLLAQTVTFTGRWGAVVPDAVALDGEHHLAGSLRVAYREVDVVARNAVLWRKCQARPLEAVADVNLEGVQDNVAAHRPCQARAA